MVTRNPGYANRPSNMPPPDPAFFLRSTIMALQTAVGSLNRGDTRDAAAYANVAQGLLADAQRDLAAAARPNLAVVK